MVVYISKSCQQEGKDTEAPLLSHRVMREGFSVGVWIALIPTSGRGVLYNRCDYQSLGF